ncbi:unnamed protein product, partial [Prorocentrum cordatum]
MASAPWAPDATVLEAVERLDASVVPLVKALTMEMEEAAAEGGGGAEVIPAPPARQQSQPPSTPPPDAAALPVLAVRPRKRRRDGARDSAGGGGGAPEEWCTEGGDSPDARPAVIQARKRPAPRGTVAHTRSLATEPGVASPDGEEGLEAEEEP